MDNLCMCVLESCQSDCLQSNATKLSAEDLTLLLWLRQARMAHKVLMWNAPH
jgi:hypothetical protein